MSSNCSSWKLIKRHAIVVDGDRVVYRAAGKGPLLLLVHGIAGSALTWMHVMPALADRFMVLAADLLGQGQSDKPRGEYSLGVHVNTLRDLLDALEHERATVNLGAKNQDLAAGKTKRAVVALVSDRCLGDGIHIASLAYAAR